MPGRIRAPVILDTGPLLTYLALRCFRAKADRDNALADIRRGELWNQDRQDRFLGMLQAQSRLLTSTYVIVEIFSLRQRSFLETRKSEFLGAAVEHLSVVEEHFVPFSELDRREVLTYGPVDASLVRLARRERGTLFTDDSRLYSAIGRDPRFDIRLLRSWD